MRQLFVDNSQANNELLKTSFYIPAEGYVAFTYWIGYTVDSGRTFTKKYITTSNVNFNGYSGVNLTAGFGINGVKAFNQNTIIVYGDYGLVPAILYSSDGGNTFKLVYHSQYSATQLSTGVMDMYFSPAVPSIGYAVDADRILKTIDGGLTWYVGLTAPNSYFDHLEGVSHTLVFAMSTLYNSNKLLRTTNGGTWDNVVLPSLNTGKLTYTYFLNTTTGWLGMKDINSKEYFYKSTNGGNSWVLQNNPDATPFAPYKFRFVDNNIGYGLYGQNTVYKTFDGGMLWEPLPRDNNYSYLNFSHNDLQCFSATQLWAGGGHGFLEMSTNGGGTPIPKANFKIDTTATITTGTVNLTNFSRTVYTYQWLLNNTLISTAYNAAYTHDVNRLKDTFTLIVSNGTQSDTLTKYQNFYPPVTISAFTPTTAGVGNLVTITGTNFTGATAVSFGGVNAYGFTVLSATSIRATVGPGASGNVRVITNTGQASYPGFTYLPPPTITSFSPTAAVAGTVVTLNGTNFTNVTAVSFGGIAATSFSVVSPSQVTAVAPSGTSGSVTITTAGGAVSSTGYVALPTLTAFTPQSGTQGTIMTLTGTSLTGTTAISVGGVSVQSFTVNSSDTITAIMSSGATGTVVVTKTGGSSSLAGFNWFAPPVVASFSPASGPVGTTVTITGTGFNTAPANNTVYFGAAKATITAGTATSLTVTVPVGATFEPISVLRNNLVAYSAYPFLLTFPNGGSVNSTSFENTASITNTQYGMQDVKLADFDGDGKTDLAVSANFTQALIKSGVLIYRNTSTTSAVSFAPPVNIVIGDYGNLSVGDLDGDGKTDLAVILASATFSGIYGIGTYRNTSTPGTISFTADAVLPSVNSPSGISIGDVDGDGKADIVAAHYPTTSIGVFRNISNPGKIAFAARVSYAGLGGRNIMLTDLDGDKKPEIVVPNAVATNFYVLKNNCTINNISFGSALSFSAYTHSYMAYGDIDGDGKTDLVSSAGNGSQLAVFRNTSSLNNFSFAAPVLYDAGAYPGVPVVTDLDGDGKLDIGVTLRNTSFGLYKNNSAPGTIALASKVDYGPASSLSSKSITAGDINGDGKNDIIILPTSQYSVLVHVSKVGPEPFIVSFTPTIGGNGSTVKIKGGNFTNVTAVQFGNVAASSFTLYGTDSITAVVGNGATGEVSVTNNVGTGTRAGFVFGLPPIISSIVPINGPVGSSVTITGNNFNPVSTDNTVYLGTIRATVTAATATSLTVTVPAGPTHQPFTVTTNNLTSYSTQHFNTTFPGAGSSFTTATFATRTNGPSGGNGGLCDIDGDGKLDIVTVNGTNSIAVARNTGDSGNVSFAANVTVPAGAKPSGFAFGDLDGDGKQDVVSYNTDSGSISLYRNSSSIGNVSLSLPIHYPTAAVTTSQPSDVMIRDVDGDGKPDIIVTNFNYYVRKVSVFRNLSTPGNLVMDTRIEYPVSNGNPTGLTVKDLNGDNKPEIIISADLAIGANIFTNTSVPGAISFTNYTNFPTASNPSDVEAGDLDGDGKLDVAVANLYGTNVSLLRNTSAIGSTVTMAANQDYTTASYPRSVSIADLDGDGKPDVLTANGYPLESVSLYKNASNVGTIRMQPRYDIPTVNNLTLGNAVGDLDGDGLPDIIVFATGGSSILRNTTGSPIPVSLCANGNTTVTASLTGTTYQWQQNSGTGFTDLTNAGNFSGVTTATLQLSNVPATWQGYQYRCITNNGTSNRTKLNFTNNWTGTMNNLWGNTANWSCGVLPDASTNVVIGSGATVVIQSNVVVNSLLVTPGSSVTVSSGYNLTVLH